MLKKLILAPYPICAPFFMCQGPGSTMRKFFLRAFEKEQGLEKAARDLRAGHHRDDVLEEAIRALEQDPAEDTVGYGGYPNVLGIMELDAAFMDGDSRNCGAVAGVTNFLPVRIARRLMQRQLHTLLIGQGAEVFAHECRLNPEPTLSDAQREAWERTIRPLLDARGEQSLMDIVGTIPSPKKRNLDTTVMIASDGQGLSGAGSTSGWPYKHPGRVGDAPIIGAGLYVDSRYGGACCTYTGEMAVRAGTARFVVAQMEAGKSVRGAVEVAIDDLSHLRGGRLRELVIHAVDCEGSPCVAAVNIDASVFYQYWNEDLQQPERRVAEAISLTFAT
jgi:isoaspartyl peptidase/L-asparaginase-like protein (Ntn-hydrolase superfamily)